MSLCWVEGRCKISRESKVLPLTTTTPVVGSIAVLEALEERSDWFHEEIRVRIRERRYYAIHTPDMVLDVYVHHVAHVRDRVMIFHRDNHGELHGSGLLEMMGGERRFAWSELHSSSRSSGSSTVKKPLCYCFNGQCGLVDECYSMSLVCDNPLRHLYEEIVALCTSSNEQYDDDEWNKTMRKRKTTSRFIE